MVAVEIRDKKIKNSSNQMMRIGLWLLCLVSYTEVKSQCCSYTLSMHDSYEDGWNGATLEVFINNSLIGTYSPTGADSNATIEVCNGDSLDLVYSSGLYEEENSYELLDSSYNLIFQDGINPDTGNVFSSIGDCSTPLLLGSSPCTAISIDTNECIFISNNGFPGSGINPNCAEFQGGDIWYTMVVPTSGSLSFETDSGTINDTGIAAWTGDNCNNLIFLSCDDDNGNGYYSFLLLYDLTPGQTLYIQAWGWGGAVGSYQICAKNLGIVILESSELPIVLINTLGQTIIENTKINGLMDIKYNGAGNLTFVNDSANIYSGNIGIEVRGATSASYPQQPFALETQDSIGGNNSVSILGMPSESDWVLISNFNDRSLIRNTLANKLFKEMGNYSVRGNLCEVIIDSVYKGIYIFEEKIKRDANRVDIAKLTLADSVGNNLTGGYILQQNYWDETNSFLSNYSPIDHPEFDIHFNYEYPKPTVILIEQKAYIASYIDSLETALYSTNYLDTMVGYRKFLDVKSFIDYFLVNELSRNADGFKKSVFYNKDRNSNGGKLKAGPVWDFDFAWKNLDVCSIFQNLDGSGWAHQVNDCFTDSYSTGWYIRMLQDSSFSNQLRCTYENYRETILDTTYIFEYIDSVKNLVQNAQARHFKKWPILGMSGPAPEVGTIATTYNAELDTLKHWIGIRLQWLDENMPGLCAPISSSIEEIYENKIFQYYPNPSNGIVHFKKIRSSETPLQLKVYDFTGRIEDSFIIDASNRQFDYALNKKGIYYFTISEKDKIIQSGKLVFF